jgi:hypothetical protein
VNCKEARDRMAKWGDETDLRSDAELASHAAECESCSEMLERHAALLDLLALPCDPPVFPDLTPAVLAAIDRRGGRAPLRWALAAALALAALGVGYAAGLLTAPDVQPEKPTMAAAYGEALSGLPSGSLESVYAGGVEPASLSSAGRR